ncbi:MAG: ATPase core protein [Campylobacterota bacterium]|nr:ATPase core protein [Campylobacterota bacterium]
MLLNFYIENFKSFKNRVDFSMEATGLANLIEGNTHKINNISLLKSAVIYGANASGKSSLLDAMAEMKSIVLLSANLNVKYVHRPFLLNTQNQNEPTSFEIEFIIDEILYYYGFVIDKNGIILKEYLEQKKLQSGARKVFLFERETSDSTEIKLGTHFKEGKKLELKTRDNSLFLSVVAQFNGEISTKIINWFKNFNILSNLKSEEFQHLSFERLKNEHFKEKIVNLVKSADVGIYDIVNKHISFEELKIKEKEVEALPSFILEHLQKNGVNTIKTEHIVYNEENSFHNYETFELNFESDGTQKLLALSAPIIDTLEKGSVLVVDELDNSLHTDLVEAIVKLFNSKETNPNNAQLIFTTHDTNLLNQEFFRRDQIWFTQKDIFGASELYSLIEYKSGSRNDLNLEKNYLEGKFGAKPNISSFGLEVQ